MQGVDEELAACGSLSDVGAFFARAIAPFGYTASACGAFVPTDKGPESHFFFLNWPPGWVALYQQNSFHEVDFSVAEARRRVAPFTWQDVKGQRILSRAEQALWETANQWGWTDGLSVPIHGPGGYLGLVTLAGTRKLSPEERDRLHLLAFHTHERCRALEGILLFPGPDVMLSTRELACLRWVAAGLTDPEIAGVMALSRETVKDHVDAARKKLGARSRPQAVARMVLAGLS